MAQELIVKTANNKKRQFIGEDHPLPIKAGGSTSSQFGEFIAATRTAQIELNSAYGVSGLRNVETLTGSGSISASSSGEILLSTGATASSAARLDSGERIRYQPGFSCELGIGIRIPTDPTGNEYAIWGAFEPDGNEGFYFGYDASGYYVAHIRNGSETKVRQADWSIDTLDGNGPSDVDISASSGNIWQINYTWYGYGQIEYGVIETVDGKQRFVTCHQFTPSGETSVQSPNLPIAVEVNNGGDASDFDIYVGGRQASTVGSYTPKFRVTGQERTGVSTSTTSVPLVSFRNKTGFENRSIKISEIIANVATEDHVIEVYLNPTLTNESWQTPTNAAAAETSVEADVSATALSGGILVYTTYATSGQANKEQATSAVLDFDVPENQIITLAARTVTGTGTADGFFRLAEEW